MLRVGDKGLARPAQCRPDEVAMLGRRAGPEYLTWGHRYHIGPGGSGCLPIHVHRLYTVYATVHLELLVVRNHVGENKNIRKLNEHKNEN
jgi:hypothetical protein